MDNTIFQNIQSLFPSQTITYQNFNYMVKDSNGKPCIIFGMDNIPDMYIDTIDKCSGLSGTEILQKIINFAKSINVSTIHLVDASRIIIYDPITGKESCKMYIYLLKILSTGQSWYNRYGFVSDNYEKELKRNQQLINLTVGEFIDQGLPYVHPLERENTKKALDASEGDFYRRVVKDLIQELIQTKLQVMSEDGTYNINCKDPTVRWLIAFLYVAEKCILYEASLQYKLTKGGYKRNRRRRQTKKQTKKQKQKQKQKQKENLSSRCRHAYR